MNNKVKINKISIARGGNGGMASKISIPKSWLDEIGAKDQIHLELRGKEIILSSIKKNN